MYSVFHNNILWKSIAVMNLLKDRTEDASSGGIVDHVSHLFVPSHVIAPEKFAELSMSLLMFEDMQCAIATALSK
jgi:hypothetical protein